MTDEHAYNPFLQARELLDHAAQLMDLEPSMKDLLGSPMREYHFAIPVAGEAGTVKIFRGFRVQHNDARGPTKGGVRFHPLETIDTIRGLAMGMTWKTAVVDIPLGGAMGGVICDPHLLGSRQMEGICRGWVRQVARDIGATADVPEPDMMTTSQHMTWMLDEYETILGRRAPGAFTGKPAVVGGSKGRLQAAGYGLVYTLREALKELGLAPDRTTASVQGFGKVAQHVVELYTQIGGRVLCVSSWNEREGVAQAFRKPEGVDLEELREIADRFGGIDPLRAAELGYEVLPGDDWLAQEVDILVPAAMENQIVAANVGRVDPQVKIVAEGANAPTTPEAEAALLERGVVVIPDLLANAGGVICSYFEQVQSNMNYYWELAEVLAKLDMKMTAAYMEISELARSKGLSNREAAMVIAVTRVAEVCRLRGWA